MKCVNFLRNTLATLAFLALLLIASPQGISGNTAKDGGAGASATTKQHLIETYGKLPLSFEANAGQTSDEVQFLSRGSGYVLFLTKGGEATLVLKDSAGKEKPKRPADALKSKFKAPPETRTTVVLKMKLIGGTINPEAAGLEQLPGNVNYFLGNDPKKWRTNVATYARVSFHEVYPGVDLSYYGNHRQLEYDFVVAPQADPDSITMSIEGATLSLDAQGNLILTNTDKQIAFQKPVAYQDVDGVRREIPSSYSLKGANQFGFQISAYDRSRPLIIDPVLAYSTYLGGNGGLAIAVDSGGNAYVTGLAGSTNFPTTPGAFQPTDHANTSGGTYASNAFVAKLNPTGSALVYATYLGGSANHNCTQISPCTNNGDQGISIAVDAAGNAYVTGSTTSSDFPTTLGAFQPTLHGLQNAFATKLNSDGTGLRYSTYLGGSNADWGFGIALDSQNNAYLTGATCSNDFPVTASAFQLTFQAGSNGEIGSQIRCVSNGFVSKLSSNAVLSQLNLGLPEPVSLAYSTYLGGASGDAAYGIAVDSQGNAYVAGTTYSFNFPVTPLAFQMSHQAPTGAPNAFVSKLNPGGSGAQSLVYSTYLGGSGGELAYGIAVDSQDNAYVTGDTGSSNFPVTPMAFQTTYHPASCPAFVTKFNSTGTALVYSTYVGGSYCDFGYGIAVDGAGNAYVTGAAGSTDFPTTPDALQLTKSPGWDAFVTVLNSTGSALVYSTFLGGNGGAQGQGIALDNAGNAYVTGFTESTDFPTTPGAFQTTQGSTVNASYSFITKFSGFPTQP